MNEYEINKHEVLSDNENIEQIEDINEKPYNDLKFSQEADKFIGTLKWAYRDNYKYNLYGYDEKPDDDQKMFIDGYLNEIGGDLKSLSRDRGVENAHKNPEEMADAMVFLSSRFSRALTLENDADINSNPQLKEVQERAKKLFMETGKKLFPDLAIPESQEKAKKILETQRDEKPDVNLPYPLNSTQMMDLELLDRFNNPKEFEKLIRRLLIDCEQAEDLIGSKIDKYLDGEEDNVSLSDDERKSIVHMYKTHYATALIDQWQNKEKYGRSDVSVDESEKIDNIRQDI